MRPENKIYLAYFKSKKNELYFNQIKELTNLSDSSLARSLKKLVKEETVSKNITKSNTFYKMKNKKLFALKFSEIALKKFNELNKGVKIPLIEFLNSFEKNIFTIVLFGSASKKNETKKSDIDLLIVGGKNSRNLDEAKKKAELISNYPLNIFNCKNKEFIESKDHLIQQAKTTGFPIKGEQNFYEVILDEY